MEIERSETELLSRIVYFSEHKKSAGGYTFAIFWGNWNRVRNHRFDVRIKRTEFAQSRFDVRNKRSESPKM